MKCPYCNEADTKVIDSRPADDNSSIRRRRQCERCGKRFTTYEKLETMPLMVIKRIIPERHMTAPRLKPVSSTPAISAPYLPSRSEL